MSSKLAPWMCAETLASHGSDHLPVVFGLQKPAVKPIPKRERTIRIPYPHNAEHHGIPVARKLAQYLERRKVPPSPPPPPPPPSPNQGGYRTGKTQPDSHTMSTKDSRGRNKRWPWLSIWKMRTTECNSNCWRNSLCNMASVWRSQDGSQQHFRKGCHATWKLDLHAPTTDNGTSQGFPLSPVLYSVYTKGMADLNSNGLSRVFTFSDEGLIYKTARNVHTAVIAVQEQMEKV